MPPTTRSQTLRSNVASTDTAPWSISSAATTATEGSNNNTSARYLTNDTAWEKSRKTRSNDPEEPPRFTIDLSLPPEQRYLELCSFFKDEMENLTSLFDEVIGGSALRVLPPVMLRFLCRILLRGVYNKEETAELRGISKASGVDMFLLVCFNVLLDLFMGCSSGGAAVSDGEGGTKMVHFRTLDWGMPALRRVIVHLDYKLTGDGEVIASAITYAGFVGVLTGVRRDLSMSLNFRGVHNDMDNWKANVKYYWHHLMVLLGFRSSISSLLRAALLPHKTNNNGQRERLVFNDYAEIVRQFAGSKEPAQTPITTTACYLCFCDGTETTVIEKDLVTAKKHSDKSFAVVTNGDFIDVDPNQSPPETEESSFAAALADIAHESKDRKECAENNWKRMCLAAAPKQRSSATRKGSKPNVAELMKTHNVVELVQRFPTTNEATHFACVMDAKAGGSGEIAWCRLWRRPVSAKWIRSHMSEGY